MRWRSGATGGTVLDSYPEMFKNSWLYNELYEARNAGPAIHKFGTLFGWPSRGSTRRSCAVMRHSRFRIRSPDYATLEKASEAKRIDYPKPDNVLSFDKLSSVFLSNTNHEEDQPCHLVLKDPTIPIAKNLPEYDEPAQRYCPAGGLRSGRRRRQAALPDQRAELRALQNLRHQGSGAEHQLGGSGGNRRTELPEHVVSRLPVRRRRRCSTRPPCPKVREPSSPRADSRPGGQSATRAHP